MAWVRYDDHFDDHPKVLHLRAGVVEALALHVLANAQTSRSRRPGFVPAAAPQALVGKAKGAKWANALVEAGLWDVVEGGWEFHDHVDYRASEKRQTAGTPEALSAKRAAAGRAGGRKTAAKRAANEASAAPASSNTSSKPCSPVVASNEATPEPVPTTSALAVPAATAGMIVAAFIEGATSTGMDRPGRTIVGRVSKTAKQLLDDGTRPEDLEVAARRLGANGWDDLEREVRRVQSERNGGLTLVRPATVRASTTDAAVAQTLALSAQLRAAEQQMLPSASGDHR